MEYRCDKQENSVRVVSRAWNESYDGSSKPILWFEFIDLIIHATTSSSGYLEQQNNWRNRGETRNGVINWKAKLETWKIQRAPVAHCQRENIRSSSSRERTEGPFSSSYKNGPRTDLSVRLRDSSPRTRGLVYTPTRATRVPVTTTRLWLPLCVEASEARPMLRRL